MRAVDIEFKKIEVTNFMSREESVDFRVIVNIAGTDRALVKSGKITDPEQMTKEIISEIRAKAKTIGIGAAKEGIKPIAGSRMAEGITEIDDSPLKNVVIVRMKNDDEELEEKMSRFFASIRERIRSCKSARLSYYDMEKKIKDISADL